METLMPANLTLIKLRTSDPEEFKICPVEFVIRVDDVALSHLRELGKEWDFEIEDFPADKNTADLPVINYQVIQRLMNDPEGSGDPLDMLSQDHLALVL